MHVQLFILNVMEQLGGKWLPIGKRRMFKHHKYFQVMHSAVQIWHISPLVLKTVTTRYPELKNKSYYVPTRAYPASPQYNCTGKTDKTLTVGDSIVIFKSGQRLSCTFTACGHWDIPQQKRNKRKARKTNATKNNCLRRRENNVCNVLISNVQVLHFGNMEKRREKMCQDLYDSVEGVLCVFAHDAPLNHLVCQAKVIVVEQRLSMSALVTHRIDPLLHIGKVVVSTYSADAELDSEYSEVVRFTQQGSVVQTVLRTLKTLSNKTVLAHTNEHVKSTFAALAQRSRYNLLCKALQNVPKDLTHALASG